MPHAGTANIAQYLPAKLDEVACEPDVAAVAAMGALENWGGAHINTGAKAINGYHSCKAQPSSAFRPA